MTIYILNESKITEKVGDLTLFKSIEALTDYVEPIDVLNSEYSAYTSDGKCIELSAKEEHPKIIAKIVADSDESHIVFGLLKSHLLNLCDVKKFKSHLNRESIEMAQELSSLISLIPPQSISE